MKWEIKITKMHSNVFNLQRLLQLSKMMFKDCVSRDRDALYISFGHILLFKTSKRHNWLSRRYLNIVQKNFLKMFYSSQNALVSVYEDTVF